MFNAFQSTYETQHYLDMDLQDRMRNPMEFMDYIQGDKMYFQQEMAQEDSGDFVEEVAKEFNVPIYN